MKEIKEARKTCQSIDRTTSQQPHLDAKQKKQERREKIIGNEFAREKWLFEAIMC